VSSNRYTDQPTESPTDHVVFAAAFPLSSVFALRRQDSVPSVYRSVWPRIDLYQALRARWMPITRRCRAVSH